MMMDRSPDSRERLVKGGFAALVLILVVVFASPIAGYLRDIFVNVSAPHESDAEYASLSRDALIARLKSAENELSIVGYQGVLYSLLSDENMKLREILNAPVTPKGILARVLSRPPRTAYDTLLVDQGASAGIQVSDLAVYQGIALGRVASVGEESALVQLFSSAGTEADAILGTPEAIAVAHGLGGGAFEIFVPQGVSVSVGDSVRTSGTASLILGVVAGVSSKPTDSSQKVSVRSPVSFADLDFIEVIPSERL
ncbi:MAG: rod shape-determining protein MreC [bacterium]|nr:rod shape-determining protein MreC [bacterium]